MRHLLAALERRHRRATTRYAATHHRPVAFDWYVNGAYVGRTASGTEPPESGTTAGETVTGNALRVTPAEDPHPTTRRSTR